MQKKLMSVLLTALMIFSQLTAFAAEGTAQEPDLNKIALIEALGMIDDYESMPNEVGAEEFKKAFAPILDGTDENTYKTATYENALRLLVNACGYKFMAECGKSYRQIAAETGLLKGTTAAAVLDKQTFCRLLINALDVPYPEMTVTGGKVGYKVNENDTLLSVRFDTYEASGLVTGNCITRLNSTAAVPVGYVEIGGRKLKDVTGCGRDLLGQRVKFYYRETDDDTELLTAYAEHNCSVTAIKAKDILGYEKNTYRYKENGRTKRFDVSNKASIIYNGQSDNGLPSDKFIPKMGEVILIDNDGNGTADVLLVYEYTAWLVSDINVSSSLLMLKNTKDEQTRKLNLADLENGREYELIYHGANAALDTLRKDSVLTVYESRTNYMLIYVCDKSVSGVLERIDADEMTAVIDGIEYDIADANKLSEHISQDGKYYLDSAGIIVWGNFYGHDEYGYLINAWQSEDLPEGCPVLKLLCSDGEIRKYDCREKFYLNDNKVYPGTDITELWNYAASRDANAKPVMYRLGNDDKVTHIYTAKSGGDDNTFRISHEYQTRWYNGSLCAFMDTRGTLDFPQPMNVDKETVIFYVPDDVTDEDNYGVGNMSELIWDQLAKSTGYRATKTHATDLIVIKGNDSRFESTLLIEKISRTINDDNEPVTAIRGLVNGYEVQTLTAAPEKDVSGLRSGDFILWYKNRLGQLADYKKCFDAAADRGLIPTSGGNEERTVYGEVTEMESGIAVINGDNGVKYEYNIQDCSMIYEFSRFNKKATKMTLGDIHIGDKIYMRMNQERIRMIVIYRD